MGQKLILWNQYGLTSMRKVTFLTNQSAWRLNLGEVWSLTWVYNDMWNKNGDLFFLMSCQLFNYHVLRTDSEDLNFCILWTSFSVLLIYVLNMVGFCPITLLGKHNCCPKTPKVITKLQSSLLSSLILSLSSIVIIINK